jgi:hypothetical protein
MRNRARVRLTSVNGLGNIEMLVTEMPHYFVGIFGLNRVISPDNERLTENHDTPALIEH